MGQSLRDDEDTGTGQENIIYYLSRAPHALLKYTARPHRANVAASLYEIHQIKSSFYLSNSAFVSYVTSHIVAAHFPTVLPSSGTTSGDSMTILFRKRIKKGQVFLALPIVGSVLACFCRLPLEINYIDSYISADKIWFSRFNRRSSSSIIP